jgi:hypothetical protein
MKATNPPRLGLRAGPSPEESELSRSEPVATRPAAPAIAAIGPGASVSVSPNGAAS